MDPIKGQLLSYLWSSIKNVIHCKQDDSEDLYVSAESALYGPEGHWGNGLERTRVTNTQSFRILSQSYL